MDAFEQLVAEILRSQGYWVDIGYRIELTKAEKRALGNPSMPRPEIDLVAYKARTGELLSLECKSYFDSGGVHARDFQPASRNAGRYKMFVDGALRKIVLTRLVEQLTDSGSVAGTPNAQLGLVYGYASTYNAKQIDALFAERGWRHYGPNWLRQNLEEMALQSYDNQVASVVAKILLRDKLKQSMEKHR